MCCRRKCCASKKARCIRRFKRFCSRAGRPPNGASPKPIAKSASIGSRPPAASSSKRSVRLRPASGHSSCSAHRLMHLHDRFLSSSLISVEPSPLRPGTGGRPGVHREMAARDGSAVRQHAAPARRSSRSLGLDVDRPFLPGVRYAARMLRKSPGFTATAVLMLAIGIGVNVAAFGFFDLMVLQPLDRPLIRTRRAIPSTGRAELRVRCALSGNGVLPRALQNASAVLAVNSQGLPSKANTATNVTSSPPTSRRTRRGRTSRKELDPAKTGLNAPSRWSCWDTDSGSGISVPIHWCSEERSA